MITQEAEVSRNWKRKWKAVKSNRLTDPLLKQGTQTSDYREEKIQNFGVFMFFAYVLVYVLCICEWMR